MQPVPDRPQSPIDDPFALLGLDRSFRIDQPALQRAWLQRTAALHPDRHPDPVQAASLLSRVNRAKSVLEDPEQRANALLVLLGGPAREQDKSLPDGFLTGMMEARQEAEEALHSADAPALERWKQWARDERENYHRQTAALFDRAVSDGAAPDTLRQLRATLNAWRYIERMIEQLSET